MSLKIMKRATAMCVIAMSGPGLAIAGGVEKDSSHSQKSYPIEISHYSSNTGIYVEGSAGYAYRPWVDHKTYFGELDANSDWGNTSNANSGFIGGVDAGYQVSQNFSAEAGWFYLPTAKFTHISRSSKTRMRMTSGLAYAALRGSIPIFNNSNIFAKVGAAYTYDEANPGISSSDSSDSSTVTNSHHWSPAFAAGAQYYFTPNCSVSAQYMYVPGDNTVSNDRFITPAAQLFTVAVGYKFLI